MKERLTHKDVLITLFITIITSHYLLYLNNVHAAEESGRSDFKDGRKQLVEEWRRRAKERSAELEKDYPEIVKIYFAQIDSIITKLAKEGQTKTVTPIILTKGSYSQIKDGLKKVIEYFGQCRIENMPDGPDPDVVTESTEKYSIGITYILPRYDDDSTKAFWSEVKDSHHCALLQGGEVILEGILGGPFSLFLQELGLRVVVHYEKREDGRPDLKRTVLSLPRDTTKPADWVILEEDKRPPK